MSKPAPPGGSKPLPPGGRKSNRPLSSAKSSSAKPAAPSGSKPTPPGGSKPDPPKATLTKTIVTTTTTTTSMTIEGNANDVAALVGNNGVVASSSSASAASSSSVPFKGQDGVAGATKARPKGLSDEAWDELKEERRLAAALGGAIHGAEDEIKIEEGDPGDFGERPNNKNEFTIKEANEIARIVDDDFVEHEEHLKDVKAELAYDSKLLREGKARLDVDGDGIGDADARDRYEEDNAREKVLSKVRDGIFKAIEDVDLMAVVRLVNEARERGDDVVNFGDEIGDRTLHRAAGTGSVEIVQFLVAAGADMHARNANDDTPLHYACMFVPAEEEPMVEHYMMVEAMFAAGAASDWDSKNKEGETPCTYAKDAFPPNVYENLLKKSQEHAFIVPHHEDAALKRKKVLALEDVPKGDDGAPLSHDRRPIPRPSTEHRNKALKPRTIGRLQWLRRQLKKRSVTPATLFKAMDTDRDGNITITEFVQGLAAVGLHINEFQSRQLFVMMDPNRDSKISWEEMEGCLMQDARKDGALELLADELEQKQLAGVDVAAEEEKSNYMDMLDLKEEDPAAYEERRRRQQASAVFQEIRAAIAQNRTVFGKKLKNANEMFAALDADGDGRVTVEEFRTGMKRMGLGLTDVQLRDVVYELDMDKDGEVDFEEFVEALQKDFDSFNPVRETEKRLEKAREAAKEEQRAVDHLCGSFAANRSARIMQQMALKRKHLEERMQRNREKVRQKFMKRRRESRDKWGQVLARSPYGVDLHQEHKSISRANDERNRLEAKLRKRRERRRKACLHKIMLEAVSDAGKLEEVRRERRELALEEARLRAMVDLERARRMGLNSKYYREKESRQRIRKRLEEQERARRMREGHDGPESGRYSYAYEGEKSPPPSGRRHIGTPMSTERSM